MDKSDTGDCKNYVRSQSSQYKYKYKDDECSNFGFDYTTNNIIASNLVSTFKPIFTELSDPDTLLEQYTKIMNGDSLSSDKKSNPDQPKGFVPNLFSDADTCPSSNTTLGMSDLSD